MFMIRKTDELVALHPPRREDQLSQTYACFPGAADLPWRGGWMEYNAAKRFIMSQDPAKKCSHTPFRSRRSRYTWSRIERAIVCQWMDR